MAEKDQARNEVNNAIISSGSAAVGLVVDAGRASQEKREDLRRKREKHEAEEKAAREAREKASVSVPPYCTLSHSGSDQPRAAAAAPERLSPTFMGDLGAHPPFSAAVITHAGLSLSACFSPQA